MAWATMNTTTYDFTIANLHRKNSSSNLWAAPPQYKNFYVLGARMETPAFGADIVNPTVEKHYQTMKDKAYSAVLSLPGYDYPTAFITEAFLVELEKHGIILPLVDASKMESVMTGQGVVYYLRDDKPAKNRYMQHARLTHILRRNLLTATAQLADSYLRSYETYLFNEQTGVTGRTASLVLQHLAFLSDDESWGNLGFTSKHAEEDPLLDELLNVFIQSGNVHTPVSQELQALMTRNGWK